MSRPRLVDNVVSHDAGFLPDDLCDVLPHGRVTILQAHSARALGIVQETVVSLDESEVEDLVGGEANLEQIRCSLVENGPVGGSLTLELLVIHVLVSVQEGHYAVSAKCSYCAGDAGQVGVVVLSGLGLDPLPYDSQAHRIEAVLL